MDRNKFSISKFPTRACNEAGRNEAVTSFVTLCFYNT